MASGRSAGAPIHRPIGCEWNLGRARLLHQADAASHTFPEPELPMRISTRTHGILDLLLGAGLLAFPWLAGFGFEPGGIVLGLAGALLITLALVTNFEIGRIRALEVPIHLWTDGVIGLLLALSPWLAGFDRSVWIPHVAAGIIVAVAAFVTNTVPTGDRRGATRAP